MEPVTLPKDDDALFELAGLDAPPPPAEGLFRGDGWLRRVSGESVLLFGGGRALLLEVAHPLVAAGVARHSNFRTDPFGRLQRTLAAMSKLTFGDRDSAFAAARSVEASHARVRGELGSAVGPFAAGARYDGRDPELVRWVWATLVDTAVVVYERFVAPLSEEALKDYYAGHRVIGRLLGVPPEGVPKSFAEFRRYVDDLVASDVLTVGEEGREIAQAVLRPPGGQGGSGPVRLITAALLPPRLRDAFGLPWDEQRAQRFEDLSASVRRLRQEADATRGTIDRESGAGPATQRTAAAHRREGKVR